MNRVTDEQIDQFIKTLHYMHANSANPVEYRKAIEIIESLRARAERAEAVVDAALRIKDLWFHQDSDYPAEATALASMHRQLLDVQEAAQRARQEGEG